MTNDGFASGDSSDSDSDEIDAQKQEADRYANATRLGTCRGWPVHIAVSQEPSAAPAPQEFGVNLFVPNAEGENIDIARIDTAHAGCHIDRFYLPENHDERTEDYSVQYETPQGAITHFLQNEEWKYYARRYEETHGLPDETRVYEE